MGVLVGKGLGVQADGWFFSTEEGAMAIGKMKRVFSGGDYERGLLFFFCFFSVTFDQDVHGFEQKVPDKGVGLN